MTRDNDEPIFEGRIDNGNVENRVQFKGGRGCTVAVLVWFALMALICLVGFAAKVYQAWTS